MKVLVTGGSGFLGRSVVAGLTAAGHEVVNADLRPPAVVMDVAPARLRLSNPSATSWSRCADVTPARRM